MYINSTNIVGSNHLGNISYKSIAKHGAEHNEDSFFINDDFPDGTIAVGIFDGVGGAECGEKASETAAKTIDEKLSTLPDNRSDEGTIQWIQSAYSAAREALFESPDLFNAKNASTTGTIAVITKKIFVAHCADSRAYLIKTNSIEPLTIDDGLKGIDKPNSLLIMSLEELQKQIKKTPQFFLSSLTKKNQLISEEKEEDFRNRHRIFCSISKIHELRLSITIAEFSKDSNSRLCLTTDGVHDNLTDKEILKYAKKSLSTYELADTLVQKAYNRAKLRKHIRAKRDDMTTIVVSL